MIETARAECPYCGEFIEATVDCSCGTQDYIEDCPVCCRPIEYRAEVDVDGQLQTLYARREDD